MGSAITLERGPISPQAHAQLVSLDHPALSRGVSSLNSSYRDLYLGNLSLALIRIRRFKRYGA